MATIDVSRQYNQTRSTPHRWLINSVVTDPGQGLWIYTASADGTILHTSLESGISQTVANLNPAGWTSMESKDWRMFYAMYGGDDVGRLRVYDERTGSAPIGEYTAHGRAKVTCLDVNPRRAEMLLSAGNDYNMRLWDTRNLSTHVAIMAHPRIVNSAYFSPVSSFHLLRLVVRSVGCVCVCPV
jgi:WD40 repeat protein